MMLLASFRCSKYRCTASEKRMCGHLPIAAPGLDCYPSRVPSLDQVLASRRRSELEDELEVSAGFGQGKATFGGLVVGAAVRSMRGRVEPARRLRSLSAQLIGAPQPGPATLVLRHLRTSATVTTMSADLVQAGQVMTHVVGVFAADRPVPLTWQQLAPPPVPPWEDVPVVEFPEGVAPEFTQHFEFRNVGAIPFGASPEPSIGYIRPRVPAMRDEAWLACVVDAWWLASITHFDGFRPAATLTLNAEFHAPLEGLPVEAPLLHRGVAHAASDGYAQESRELWGVDGRLVVTCTELVAIIK